MHLDLGHFPTPDEYVLQPAPHSQTIYTLVQIMMEMTKGNGQMAFKQNKAPERKGGG